MAAINVGLIGTGRIGRMHAQHLAFRVPGARLLAVANRSAEAAESCAAESQVPAAFTEYQRILDNPDIHAVVICTSTDTHARIIEEAAAAGKHIFCEKPLDLDLARINQVLAAVAKAGVKLQVGFNRRFDSNFRRVRELVAGGEIGEPHIVHIIDRDPQPPPIEFVRCSGGMFLDLTIHDFDMVRYLISSEVTELYALGGVMVDADIGRAGDIDTAVVALRFANGAMGSIDNSRQAVYGYDQRVEVFGSKGMVAVSNKKPDTTECSTSRGVQSALPLHWFVERYTDSYIAEMRAFIECVQEDKPPPVTGLDARIASVMAHAASKSHVEKRPVKPSEIDTTMR